MYTFLCGGVFWRLHSNVSGSGFLQDYVMRFPGWIVSYVPLHLELMCTVLQNEMYVEIEDEPCETQMFLYVIACDVSRGTVGIVCN